MACFGCQRHHAITSNGATLLPPSLRGPASMAAAAGSGGGLSVDAAARTAASFCCRTRTSSSCGETDVIFLKPNLHQVVRVTVNSRCCLPREDQLLHETASVAKQDPFFKSLQKACCRIVTWCSRWCDQLLVPTLRSQAGAGTKHSSSNQPPAAAGGAIALTSPVSISHGWVDRQSCA